MGNGYFEYCELLFREFLAGDLQRIPELGGLFSWSHCPEPYVWIGNDKAEITPPYLTFVELNPGEPFWFQERAAIITNDSAIKVHRSYQENACRLGEAYSNSNNPHNINAASIIRYQKAQKLSQLLNLNGVLCVEPIPIHSTTFDAARVSPSAISVGWLRDYATVLQHFLVYQTILMISVTQTPELPMAGRPQTLHWRRWRAELGSIDLADLERIEPFGGASQTLWRARNRSPAKVLYLVQGNLVMPRDARLALMANGFRN